MTQNLGAGLDEVISRCRPRLRTDEEIAQEFARRAALDEAHRRERFVLDLKHDLGARYYPERASFDCFRADHSAQKRVLKQLQEIDIKILVEEGAGIILFGPVGTGKDHLQAAMLYKAAREGFSGKWINGQDWYGSLRDRIKDDRAEAELLASLTKPDILAISDPLPAKRELSGWNAEMLYCLVDRRYRNLKSTWITINATDEMDADQRLTSPVFDRLRDNAHIIRCFWDSFRGRGRATTGAKAVTP